ASMTLEQIPRDWKPPARLGYSTMRPVRLTKSGVAMTVFAVVLVSGGLILGGVLLGQSRRQEETRRLLRKQGVPATAVVERVWRTGGEDNKHRARYVLTVSGVQYRSSLNVPRGIWRTLGPGMILPVRYLPSNPAISHPEAWEASVTPWALALLIPVLFALG